MAVESKRTILVVEDEQIVALDISNALNALGYSVPTVASSGAEAIARAEELRPGLVLMDVRIDGDMDGIATAAQIRERFDIPVVFLTAYADDDSLTRAKASSPFGYLLKPFNRRELRTAIEVGLYRHEIESRLAERERWLATILSSIRDAVIAVDPEGHVAFMNPAAERLTGVKREVAPGLPLKAVLSMPTGAEDLAAALANNGREATVFTPATGHQIPVDGSVSPITFDDGREGSVIVLRDVTERRVSEDRLRRTQQGFRETVEALNDCVAVVRGGSIVYANGAWVRALGLDSSAVLRGRSLASLVHDDERELFAQRLATGHLEAAERRFTGPAGVVTLECGPSKLIEFEGETALLLAGRDVTERKRLQAKLLVADRMASVGTLAAGVAHEINNPLTYTMANLELASLELKAADLKGRSVETATEALSDALLGVQRVAKIVRDLKSFSRIDTERKRRIQLQPTLDLAFSLAGNEIRHRARLVREYGVTPAVRADEARLSQVFVNLLVNAAQAMPDGRAEANEVAVRTRTDERGWAVIEVRDTGVGMSPDVQKRIFDPFFTTKPVGVGTGLGLSICHEFIAASGGEIEVESQVGHGSTFRILLPPDTSTPAPEPLEPRRAEHATVGKLLVVDDELDICTAVAACLAPEHQVTYTVSGRDALTRIERGERFDVIICDLMMPNVSGVDVYETLLRVAPQQAKAMVFMTGGAFTPTAAAFLAGTPNLTIEKPFDLAKLREVVRQALAAATPATSAPAPRPSG